MKKLLITAITSASLAVLPLAAMAQTNDAAPENTMKGPPNANGFGKDQTTGRSSSSRGMSGTDLNNKGGPTSAKDLKGPPNANGYGK